jgi:light-regulated signal transduction histidine kinase (bacteriophytochrome)
MSVESSLSISLMCQGKLWGLIACHNNSPRNVSLFIQKFCAMMSKFVSNLIEQLTYAKRISGRSLITEKASDSISVGKNVNGYIVANSEDLLKLFGADYSVISLDAEAKVMGEADESTGIIAFVDYLRLNQLKEITYSDCVSSFFPDFPYQSSEIAGFLCIPLSKSGVDFICFIRREQVKVSFENNK